MLLLVPMMIVIMIFPMVAGFVVNNYNNEQRTLAVEQAALQGRQRDSAGLPNHQREERRRLHRDPHQPHTHEHGGPAVHLHRDTGGKHPDPTRWPTRPKPILQPQANPRGERHLGSLHNTRQQLADSLDYRTEAGGYDPPRIRVMRWPARP